MDKQDIEQLFCDLKKNTRSRALTGWISAIATTLLVCLATWGAGTINTLQLSVQTLVTQNADFGRRLDRLETAFFPIRSIPELLAPNDNRRK